MEIQNTFDRLRVFGADVAEGYLALSAGAYALAITHNGFDAVADSFAHDRTAGDVLSDLGDMTNNAGTLLVSYVILRGVQRYRDNVSRRLQQ